MASWVTNCFPFLREQFIPLISGDLGSIYGLIKIKEGNGFGEPQWTFASIVSVHLKELRTKIAGEVVGQDSKHTDEAALDL